MGQTDSALVDYKVAAGSLERESDLYNFTKMKSSIGPLYLALEDFNAASSCLTGATGVLETLNNFSDLIDTLHAQADRYLSQRKWEAARRSAARSSAWAGEKPSWYGARTGYEYRALAAESLGHNKAALAARSMLQTSAFKRISNAGKFSNRLGWCTLHWASKVVK